MDKIIDAIRAIRNRRAEMNVPPSKKAQLIIVTDAKDAFNESTTVFFEKLASASEVVFADSCDDDKAVSIGTDSAKFYIPMNDIIDTEKERARLTKEKETAQKEIERLEKKLGNPEFVSKAPEKVIAGEREKLEKYTSQLKNIEEMIANL